MLKGMLVMSCIRPCVQLFMGLALCIADKALGRNGQQIGMLMYPDDLCSAVIDNYGYYCLCVCLTVCWCFHLLGLVFGFGYWSNLPCDVICWAQPVLSLSKSRKWVQIWCSSHNKIAIKFHKFLYDMIVSPITTITTTDSESLIYKEMFSKQGIAL